MKLRKPPRPKALRWSARLARLPALSIRQPYAWLVANGIKDLENRSWRTWRRGPILIHASSNRHNLTAGECARYGAKGRVRMPPLDAYEFGGIIGYAEIVDCVRHSDSVWKHRGTWGWVLRNARPIRFRRCKGAVGFFRPRPS
ncbi:MAG TPA: ASCH domain-containing protein [Opitutaceae bacterium]|nr:ASCH domain-containing protein [Opitutaceae bacterium]